MSADKVTVKFGVMVMTVSLGEVAIDSAPDIACSMFSVVFTYLLDRYDANTIILQFRQSHHK